MREEHVPVAKGFILFRQAACQAQTKLYPMYLLFEVHCWCTRLCRAVMCIDERLCTWKVTVPGENKIKSICAKMFPCRVSNKFAQNIRTTFFDLLYSIHNSFEAFWNDTLKAKKNSQYDTGSIATGGHLLGCITQRSILDYPHILRSWHHSYNRNELFRA